MNERYDPGAISTKEPRQPEEKIQAFFDEFLWLHHLAKEIVPRNYRRTYIIKDIRVVRVHGDMMHFRPRNWIFWSDLSTDLSKLIDKVDKPKVPRLTWYVVEGSGRIDALEVGTREKWRLTSQPRWYAPWRPWRVEWKEIEFPESIGEAIRREFPDSNRIRYIVQIGTHQEEKNSLPEIKLVIYKVPKEFTLATWIEEDKRLKLLELKEEVKAEVAKTESC